jgi:hypothetical protein
MNCTNVESRHFEVFYETIRATLGAAKDHGSLVNSDNSGGEFNTLACACLPEIMHGGLADRIFFGIDLVTFWVVLVATDELFDVSIECRGEKQCLSLVADLIKNLADNGHEPHIRHTVSLIDNNGLHIMKADCASIHEIHQTPRTGNGDVNTTSKRIELWSKTYAAIEARDTTIAQ